MPKTCKHTKVNEGNGKTYHCTNHVFGGGYCRNHQHMRTDKKPKQFTRSKIKPISDTQKKRLKAYSIAREIYMKENPKCEFGNCNSNATEIHHKKGRGIETANPEHFMSICRYHHSHIHNNPSESRTLGYLI